MSVQMSPHICHCCCWSQAPGSSCICSKSCGGERFLASESVALLRQEERLTFSCLLRRKERRVKRLSRDIKFNFQSAERFVFLSSEKRRGKKKLSGSDFSGCVKVWPPESDLSMKAAGESHHRQQWFNVSMAGREKRCQLVLNFFRPFFYPRVRTRMAEEEGPSARWRTVKKKERWGFRFFPRTFEAGRKIVCTGPFDGNTFKDEAQYVSRFSLITGILRGQG